jgi:hypothetical protein
MPRRVVVKSALAEMSLVAARRQQIESARPLAQAPPLSRASTRLILRPVIAALCFQPSY